MPTKRRPYSRDEFPFKSTQDAVVVLDAVDHIPAGESSRGTRFRELLGSNVPDSMASLADSLPGADSDGVAWADKLFDSVADGIERYTDAHGVAPSPDLLLAAMQQADSARHDYTNDGIPRSVMDSVGGSDHHAANSINANRALLAIEQLFETAIPFGSYLATDISSNEARLHILSHIAASTHGGYKANDSLNGGLAGKPFASSSRWMKFGGDFSAPQTQKVTSIVDRDGFCVQTDGLVVPPILRGRTIVYINGLVAAEERPNPSGETSPIAGAVTINGTEYSINAKSEPGRGLVTINSISPALPEGSEVVAQAYIDYERAPALTPRVGIEVETFSMYANPNRITTSTTIDFMTQLQRELSIDGQSQALQAVRTQLSMERHFEALRMARRLAKNTSVSHDLDLASRNSALLHWQIWQDFLPALSAVLQIVVEKTADASVEVAYVGRRLASEFLSLPREMFVPSGVRPRPGVYRLGRLFDLIDLYFLPDGENILRSDSAVGEHEMLLIGRGSQPGRSPIVLGDAVPPTLLSLATNADFNSNLGMYSREFTRVNPHYRSAHGAALMTIKGIK